MSTSLPPPPKRFQLHFDVATEDQAQEFSAAWDEIVSNKGTRMDAAAETCHECRSLVLKPGSECK
jgi:hypothetical protein